MMKNCPREYSKRRKNIKVKTKHGKTARASGNYRRLLFVPLVMILPLTLSSCFIFSDDPTLGEFDYYSDYANPLVGEASDGDYEITYLHENLRGEESDEFELPLSGSTGYASIETPVYYSADTNSEIIETLNPGDSFTVLEERDDHWWMIARDSNAGWVDNKYCYLNISDVVPSIVVNNTNSSASVFVSSGVDIPDITGERLYQAVCYNARLDVEQAVMAANYGMVKKIYKAQELALEEGYTLILNETFRPYDVQIKVAESLKALCEYNDKVRRTINRAPWSINWFIANGASTHQWGCAMDVSLARVREMDYRLTGGYKYAVVTKYDECKMPCDIHELSPAAVSMSRPVNSSSKTAWRSVSPATTMTTAALQLRDICTKAGLYPLASEWWHFNDLETSEKVGKNYTTEAYRINTCRSMEP